MTPISAIRSFKVKPSALKCISKFPASEENFISVFKEVKEGKFPALDGFDFTVYAKKNPKRNEMVDKYWWSYHLSIPTLVIDKVRKYPKDGMFSNILCVKATPSNKFGINNVISRTLYKLNSKLGFESWNPAFFNNNKTNVDLDPGAGITTELVSKEEIYKFFNDSVKRFI